MRPAWSIIFFPTMSGLGLGLAGWVVIGLLPLMSREAVIGVGVITLALIGAGALVATDLLVPGSSLCQLLRVLRQWPMKGSKVPSHSFLFSWWRGRAGGDGPSYA